MANLSTTDIDSALAAAVQAPKSVEVDGVKQQAHSLNEMIAAHKYLTKCAASASPNKGLSFRRLVAPSAIG
ncbi:MAG TPA: hypothetical protein DDW52_16670 [Planctomycetaceae bacterium]|nr:hypothetical protein [Planctomycetaceae bacterium]